ncbi:twin-arginine translocase TatA/TatE family subunit [Kocuria sabuli]|uniref:twin-arginine translocase TatA/TatE family subunit n=1 Tax=Kocuria sabuli TaxID=3071448 RepID=UPI0034D41F8E
MARLFDNPMSMLLILLVVLLLFGAPKLPGMARSLGHSLRILKSEMADLSADERLRAARTGTDPHPAPAAHHATAAHAVESRQQGPGTVTRSRPGG